MDAPALSQENYKSNNVKLSIGESTYIGKMHIVALKNIRISTLQDVLIGDNVYIADNYVFLIELICHIKIRVLVLNLK